MCDESDSVERTAAFKGTSALSLRCMRKWSHLTLLDNLLGLGSLPMDPSFPLSFYHVSEIFGLLHFDVFWALHLFMKNTFFYINSNIIM